MDISPKLRISKIPFTDHVKFWKKEDQNVDASVLRRRGNKIFMGANTETKCRTKTKGKAIQRLPYLGIHPIYSHQTQTLLQMPRSASWQEPDIAVSWEVLLESDKYRGRCSQPTTELSTRSPMEEFEKGRGSWRGLQLHKKNYNINQPEPRTAPPPELSGTKPPTKEYTWKDPWFQLHM